MDTTHLIVTFMTSLILIQLQVLPVTSQSNLPGCQVADIAFVVDSSDSILPEYWENIKQFLISFVDALTIGPDAVQIGLIQYSSNANMPTFYLFDFQTKQEIIDAIDQIENIGSQTNTAAGLDLLVSHMFVSSNGDRSIAPNIAIVLTDGQSNVRTEDLQSSADTAKLRGKCKNINNMFLFFQRSGKSNLVFRIQIRVE